MTLYLTITFIMPPAVDLPAANADIRLGDKILEVQGTDVRNASGQEVVEMIQYVGVAKRGGAEFVCEFLNFSPFIGSVLIQCT